MKRFLLLWLVVSSFSLGLVAREGGRSQEPGKDKATIVFFREGHYAGSALKPSIYLDGKDVGRLTNGHWFSVEVDPGKHELASTAKNEAHTVIETTAGQTTYVQMVIVPGTWRGAGRLMEVDTSDAKEKIAKLKLLEDKVTK